MDSHSKELQLVRAGRPWKLGVRLRVIEGGKRADEENAKRVRNGDPVRPIDWHTPGYQRLMDAAYRAGGNEPPHDPAA